MLKIGDFSSLSQISVKALRHYDDLGLLKPAHVDHSTGYRYYSARQLPRLHRIIALKDLGFTLEQIAALADELVSAEQLRGMLLLRQSEQQRRVRDESDRLLRIGARLSLIDQEGTMYQKDIVIKSVPAQWIASVREVIPNYKAVGSLYGEIYSQLGQAAAAGLPVAIWHDREFKEQDVDAEAGVYLASAVDAAGRIQVHELPAATVASLVHHGPYNTLSQAYDALLHWVEANGRATAGPIRELYLQCGQPVRQDDPSYVTEIQVPVQAANAGV